MINLLQERWFKSQSFLMPDEDPLPPMEDGEDDEEEPTIDP